MELMDRRGRTFDMLGGILSAFPWVRYVAPKASGYTVLTELNKKLKSFIMVSLFGGDRL